MKLKEEFLKLLESDKEFRYAIAGFIGLGEILKRLEAHDRKFNEILERLNIHDGKFNEITSRLEIHDKKFNEILRRLDEHDKKFNEILERLDTHTKRLDVHDKKFNEILERLNEHDEKFNEITSRLEVHDKKFNEIVEELKEIREDMRDIKAYIERTSISLEEEAREVLTNRLKTMGITIKLDSLILPDVEINIYGVNDDLCIIGETSTRAGIRIIESLERKIKILERKYPEYLRKNTVKVLYTMWATNDTIMEAKNKGIWLLKAIEDLTTPPEILKKL